MKRYWLFMWNQYYPGGGLNDFMGDFDTIEECKQKRLMEMEKWYHENYEIFDLETKTIKKRGYSAEYVDPKYYTTEEDIKLDYNN